MEPELSSCAMRRPTILKTFPQSAERSGVLKLVLHRRRSPISLRRSSQAVQKAGRYAKSGHANADWRQRASPPLPLPYAPAMPTAGERIADFNPVPRVPAKYSPFLELVRT